MVQLDDAHRIYRQWVEAGRPPCDHDNVEREYHLSSNTGDWVCMNCGENFSRQQVDALRAKRQKGQGQSGSESDSSD